MATTQLTEVFRRLCSSAFDRQPGGATDGQLLERFIGQKDDRAFEALVRQHGPMVWGVCRRLLRNEADAEDAFQATFLVLVRKAGSIRPRSMVGNWLYGVAQNTARKAMAMNQKRRLKERAAGARRQAVSDEESWQRLQPILDQELPSLPDKYRVAIVLCDLEGKSIKEVARQLGWPPGTVATRLTRGRALLARRLTRHGLCIVGAGLATLLAQSAAWADVPVTLIPTTIRAASLFAAGKAAASGVLSSHVTALTEGVVKMMLLTKLKNGAWVLFALGLLGAASALAAGYSQAAQRQANAVTEANPAVPQAVEGQKPAPKEEFANGLGWKWMNGMPRLRRELGTIRSHSQSAGVKDELIGYVAFFETDPSGALVVYLAYRSKDLALEYRPVAFDNQQKRYALTSEGGGGSAETHLSKFRLDPRQLPDAKVMYVGIEYLNSDGRKTVAADARQRLRQAGIDILPPGRLGQAYDFELTTIENQRIRASDLRGKVVLVDCWATWCSPCMQKMPALKALYKQYHAAGLEVVGVCFDNTLESARKAIKKEGLDWPQVLVPTDEALRETWENAAEIESVPHLMLIDRAGILQAICGPGDLQSQIEHMMKPAAGDSK